MERLAQFLDDLDDLIAAVGLLAEAIRCHLLSLLYALMFLAMPAGGIVVGLLHPPLALAIAMLLFVVLLYHTVTSPHRPLEIV